MKTVVFLLVTLKIATVFVVSESNKNRVVPKGSLKIPYRRVSGGLAATENQFPFMVILVHYKTELNTEKCSCSLLKADLLLTTAHCTKKHFPEKSIVVGGQADYSSYFEMRLGFPARAKLDFAVYNMQERWPSEFIPHPAFKNEGDRFYDIALVRLREPFTLPNIRSIPISTEKMKKPMNCTVLGWGLTAVESSTYALHYTYAIAKAAEKGCEFVKKGPVLCLEKGKIATCFGDSGSPLVCNGKVWGVAAFIRFKGIKRCDKGAEDYYTEIHPVLNWLKNPSSGESSVVAASKNAFFFTNFCLLFLFEKFVVYL